VTQRSVLLCRVANPLKESLTALADALAKRPAEEILFDWFRSNRLIGELSVLIKHRHPAKGGVTRQRKTIDCGKGRYCAAPTAGAGFPIGLPALA
jgi:hypothetical protein